MWPQPAARTGTPAAPLVPAFQRLRALVQRSHEPFGVDQVVVLAAVGRPVEVFAGQPQPEVAGEDAGAVTGSPWVSGLAIVPGGVEHRTGELAVVGPGPPVEVVTAH